MRQALGTTRRLPGQKAAAGITSSGGGGFVQFDGHSFKVHLDVLASIGVIFRNFYKKTHQINK